MWYNIDFRRHALDMLLTDQRVESTAALAQIMTMPLESLHRNWKLWREANLYKVEHTGQVCSLRKSLNDFFDPSLRRIYIGDGNAHNTTYIYTEGEAQKVYINDTLYLRTEDETADTGLDFIVWVPQEIYDTQIHALKAHIDFYRIGGKRYSIFIINE